MDKPILNLVVIRSKDINRSAEFYSTIGLHLDKHQHGSGPEHFTYEHGASVFEIYPRQGENDSTSEVRIGFQVTSVDNVIENLMRIGATIVSVPKNSPWGRRAVIKDIDGHRVELTQPSKEAG